MDIYTFLSSIYKMVDSMDIYKSLNINIGTVVKNQKIRLKKVCDKAVNTYPPTITFVPKCRMTQMFFVFDYIPNPYTTQEMCNYYF